MNVGVITPCFNESENLDKLYAKIASVFKKYDKSIHWQIYFVDDGSTDLTVSVINKIQQKNKNVFLIELSRNYGHQTALRAGIDSVDQNCDIVISMDADLQHPPELIPEMIDKWQSGYDVVYTTRQDTENEGFLKKITSKMFYWLFNRLATINMQPGVADFRLYDSAVVDALKQYEESSYFLRGIVASMGFKQISIKYKAVERYAGKSNYTYRKMFRLARDGVLSFSSKPLRLAIYSGLFLAILSFCYACYAVLEWFVDNSVVPGWSSITAGIFFMGGLNLIFIGIIGEYLGMVFIEVKRRPHYHIVKETRRNKV